MLKSIVHDFPDLCSLVTIGKSVEGRDLNVLKIDYKGNPKDSTLVQIQDDADDDIMAAAIDNTLKDGIPDKAENA